MVAGKRMTGFEAAYRHDDLNVRFPRVSPYSGTSGIGQALLFLMLSRVPNDFERIIWEWPLKL